MPNSLCRAIGHGWREMTVKGWFRCVRLGCGAYAVCPSCVRSRPKGALSCVCEGHQGVQVSALQREGGVR
jgi:hypothetical protein